MSLKKLMRMRSIAYAQQVIGLLGASNIVYYYGLNATAGSLAVNLNAPGSGDGTVTGATWDQRKTLAGEPSLSFDGVNDSISLGAGALTYLNARLDPTEFTILWWWYQTAAQQGNGNQLIFRCNDDANNSFLVRQNNGAATTLRRVSIAGTNYDTYINWTADQWNHGALVISDDSHNDHIFDYVNGVKYGVGSTNIAGDWGGDGFDAWIHGLDELGNNDFAGELSHIIVVNGEVSAADIATIYALGGGT